MDSWLILLAVLICPLSMGLLMLFMARKGRSKRGGPR